MRAGQEADLSEHVKDRPQREGRRRSTPAAPPAASAPGGSDDPAAARRAAATLAAASAARCDVAVRVVALGGGEYAIKILLPPEVVEVTQPINAPAGRGGSGGGDRGGVGGGGGGDGAASCEGRGEEKSLKL